MTAFDIFVLVVVGLSALYGLSRGLTTEVFSLASWFAGFLALKLFFPLGSMWMRTSMDSRAGGDIAAFLLIFVTTYVLVRILAGYLGRSIRNSALGSVDRMGGAGFGVVRGLLICSLGYLFIGLFADGPADYPDWVREGKTTGIVATSAEFLGDFVGLLRETADPAETSGLTDMLPLDPGLSPAAEEGYSLQERQELDRLLDQQADNARKI